MNRIVNPLMAPERSSPYRLNRVGIPINVHTRGEPTGYQQVGVLIEETGNGENKLLPLSITFVFIIIFIIFFKGLQNTNIYTPETKTIYKVL